MRERGQGLGVRGQLVTWLGGWVVMWFSGESYPLAADAALPLSQGESVRRLFMRSVAVALAQAFC